MAFVTRKPAGSIVSACLICCLCVSAAGAGAARPASAETTPEAVDRAIARAVKWLIGCLDQEGKYIHEEVENEERFGGRTAIILYALMTAGVDRNRPEVARALRWLQNAKLCDTYAVALRANVYAAIKSPRTLELLQRDVDWLIRAANDQGGYTYTSSGGEATDKYDNSNSQMAILGVWAGARRGVKVPSSYWKKVQRYWLDQQRPDGGWNYSSAQPHQRNQPSYGSMTAAGLATLYVCMDALRGGSADRNAGSDPEAISKGLNWITENFSAVENPRKSVQWYYYWMYSLERVGLASGYKCFGDRDWYAEGVRELLSRQKGEGSWGGYYPSFPVADTAFALLFLARGRNPILANKLNYGGKWNSRSRDLANLTDWISYTLEHPVNWQVVSIRSSLKDWHDAPILYISGAGPVEMTDEEVAKLRRFALQGGLIVSEAAYNNGDFTLDMQKIYKRAFGRYPLRRIDDGHALYSLHFSPKGTTGLMGVTNGVRLLAIHSPRELSGALQLGPGKANVPLFELMANMYLFATDKGTLRAKGTRLWLIADAFSPAATVTVTRVKYDGNYDPEPLALDRLGVLMGNRWNVELRIAPATEIARLDAAVCPIALMTGTEAFTLTEAEKAALKKFFADGGSMIIDAAGGSKAFSDAVSKHILPLTPQGYARRMPASAVTQGPAPLERINYRRDYALALGRAKHELRLRAAMSGDKPVVVFSSDDLTSGLVGHPCYGLRGYAPETALAIMTNLLCKIAGEKTPASQPTASGPTPTP